MKKMAGELPAVEKHFNTVLEKISEGVIEIASDGMILYANATALSFFKISEEKLLGSDLVELFAGDDRQRVLRLLRETGKQPSILASDPSLSLNEYWVKLKILSVENIDDEDIVIDIGGQIL
jgi:PAS domain S-box-containing protein